jgi:hypothetical protein
MTGVKNDAEVAGDLAIFTAGQRATQATGRPSDKIVHH